MRNLPNCNDTYPRQRFCTLSAVDTAADPDSNLKTWRAIQGNFLRDLLTRFYNRLRSLHFNRCGAYSRRQGLKAFTAIFAHNSHWHND